MRYKNSGKITQKQRRLITQQAHFAARRRADSREVSDKDAARLFRSPCAVCGAPGEHLDHIVPLRRGGRHSIGNLQRLCADCNRRKGRLFMVEWLYSSKELPAI